MAYAPVLISEEQSRSKDEPTIRGGTPENVDYGGILGEFSSRHSGAGCPPTPGSGHASYCYFADYVGIAPLRKPTLIGTSERLVE
jgi:hypothetical protein